MQWLEIYILSYEMIAGICVKYAGLILPVFCGEEKKYEESKKMYDDCDNDV